MTNFVDYLIKLTGGLPVSQSEDITTHLRRLWTHTYTQSL